MTDANHCNFHHIACPIYASNYTVLFYSTGSGPTIRQVMSASAKYRDITLSDPAPQNRHMLEDYMQDANQDHRWIEHFKLTAKLEGNVEKWTEVQHRVRLSIKQVILV